MECRIVGRYCSPSIDPSIKTSMVLGRKAVWYNGHVFRRKERLIPHFKVRGKDFTGWINWRSLRVEQIEGIVAEKKWSTELRMFCNVADFYPKGDSRYLVPMKRMINRDRCKICLECKSPICPPW